MKMMMRGRFLFTGIKILKMIELSQICGSLERLHADRDVGLHDK